MMHILCSTDKNYIMPTGVMIKSVSVNNKDEEIFFHVIVDDSVTKKHKKQLYGVLSGIDGHSILFYSFDNSLLNTFPQIGNVKRDYMTKATYYRLFVERILSNDIEKVIYLDSDIIVNKSLSQLWDIDVSGFALAGVTDMSENIHDYNRLGFDKDLGYFNAGVLVINLRYWRDNHIVDNFLDIILNHPEKIKWHDQDILNMVCCKNKIQLPFIYNLQNGFLFKEELLEIDPFKYKDEIKHAINNYIIVHYTDTLKPWHYECNHPLKKLWFLYLNMTRWKGYRPVRKYPISLKNRIGNFLRKYHLRRQLPIAESIYKTIV